MKPCFGYVRVSTVKQGDGVSLEAQKDAILEYARRKNLTITRWWAEKETAAKQGRPVFNEMVARLKQGEAKGLLIHKIDRSARNYHDWAIISDLADTGIEFHIATESFDFNTYGGRMAADFMAVVAANYVRNLKTEIRKGQLGQLKIGLIPWAAPVGYRNNGAAKLKTPDPLAAPLVRRAFELYGSGTHSIRTLTIEMRKQGLRTQTGRQLHKSNIENMLGNPFYCGIIRVRRTSETFKGAHEPIITTVLFERVQDIKSGKKVKKFTRHNHMYRGLFRCQHCGHCLIGEIQKGRVYYRCQTAACATKTIREDRVSQAVIALLHQISLTPDDLAVAYERLPAMLMMKNDGRECAAIELQRDQVAARLDRLTDMVLDGLIDGDAFQAKKQALLIEQRRIDEQLAIATSNTVTEATARRFLELATNLALLYDSATKPEKRRIVEWATSNRTATEKCVCFEPSKWLKGTKTMLAALSSADARDYSRTEARAFADLIDSVSKLSQQDSPLG
jgi:DNA invertase Pin-like site-specific DNA recombinase